MIEYLNENEIYRVGMSMEQAGLDFYMKMADKADDPATRRVFKQLARDEKEHLAFFESLETGTSRSMGSGPAERDADVSRYVSSLVKGGIFANIERMGKLARGRFNAEKALELALQMEKDAVLYYMEAHGATRKRSTKQALARLADEEKRHVVQITNRLARMRKKARTAGK